MLLGRGDVFSEERLRQMTSTWDMVQGRAVIVIDNIFESYSLYDQAKCCNFQYKLLEVSCLSSVGRGWSLKVKTDFLQCFRKQIKKVASTGK